MKGDRDWRPSRHRNAYLRTRRALLVRPPADTLYDERLMNDPNPDARTLPYSMRPAIRADREDRESMGITPEDYGTRWRAAYSSLIGDPPLLSPGDHDGAREYLSRIESAIERGGWTKSERGALQRMRVKWSRRERGEDAYFEVIGNRAGRISREDYKLVQALRVIIEARTMGDRTGNVY